MEAKMTPTAFLGCSTEALPIAYMVQNALADKALVQVWNQGFFLPGSYVLETLISNGDTFDFAILLFSNDDVVEIRGQKMLTARDNTVLEAGFFIGRLGRQRTFIMVPDLPEQLHLPSDFSGLMHIKYHHNAPPNLQQAVITQACFLIGNSIQNLGRRTSMFEKSISAGMVYLMRVLNEQQGMSDASRLGPKLAKYNNTIIQSDAERDAWSKSAQYIMAFLHHLKLVDIRAFTLIEYILTSEGKSYIDSPAVADEFPQAFSAPL
jgi:Predicted nucleotide-binding protein containing TIR-like domain